MYINNNNNNNNSNNNNNNNHHHPLMLDMFEAWALEICYKSLFLISKRYSEIINWNRMKWHTAELHENGNWADEKN